jgi:hypothetical protein
MGSRLGLSRWNRSGKGLGHLLGGLIDRRARLLDGLLTLLLHLLSCLLHRLDHRSGLDLRS